MGKKKKNKNKNKNKALLVALSYRDNEKRSLGRAPIRSIGYMKRLLMDEFKFCQSDIKLVTDELGKTPTDDEIIIHLLKLLENAKPGDVLFFYYIGHGGRRESKNYNNNSGFIEYISLGMNALGVRTVIPDYTLRQLVEPLPQGCSFTFMADSCCSGALLEGATEIIGNSTRFPVTDKLPPPMTEHVDKKVVDPTNCRKLGILVSACQSGEVIGSKYCAVRKKNVSYFTNTLISTIKKFGVNISNKFLVEEITKVYAEEGITRASPGLYCDESQINLKLLSLEEVDNQPSSSHQIEEE